MDTINVRKVPRAIATRKLADLADAGESLQFRTVYVAERGDRLSGPWVCVSPAPFERDGLLGPLSVVELQIEADYWRAHLMGSQVPSRAVPVRFCVTVAL